MIRKIVLEMSAGLCQGKGPDISILLDGELIDRLSIDRSMTYHFYKNLEEGDHTLSVVFHNEDNTRFYDHGEDPDGEIRCLHVDILRFANDGTNLVPFDLRNDVLADMTPLFIADESLGIIPNGWGFSMYKNAQADIILPVRQLNY